MKQNKFHKIYPGEESMDPKLKKDLDSLIEKGYIKRFVENGVTIYGITPLGDRYVEDVVMKKEKNKLPKLP